MMDIHQILKHLPHRYPFVLVDRVLELEKGKRIKALKNVTINEPYFVGHFPHRPVMPGVLMLEAMAQTAAFMAFDMHGRRCPTTRPFIILPASTARASSGRWSRATSSFWKWSWIAHAAGIYKFKARALVAEELACEAELMCTMRTIT